MYQERKECEVFVQKWDLNKLCFVFVTLVTCALCFGFVTLLTYAICFVFVTLATWAQLFKG